jgi:hypothetical protein
MIVTVLKDVHNRILKSFSSLLRWLMLLSILDGFLTVLWVYGGIATEANPLLVDILNERVGLFWISKTLLVGLGAVLLSKNRQLWIAQCGLLLSLFFYMLITFEHVRISTLMIWKINNVPDHISSDLANLYR